MSKQKLNNAGQITIEDFIASFSRSILPEVPVEGSYDVLAQLKYLLSYSIKAAQKSRDEVADIMTEGLPKGQTITKAQIDGWTRSDSERHIPMEYIYAFEMSCSTSAITEYLCKLHGGKFIDRRSSDVLDLGQLQVLKTRMNMKEKELHRGLE
jgi:hypothetical protein